MEACSEANGFVCFDRTAESEPVEAEPVALNVKPRPVKVRLAAANAEKPADPGDKAASLDAKNAMPAWVAAADPAASGLPAAMVDPVTVKAKTAIAAKLENPASAEFSEMNRAFRKNVRGESVDTICGRVKGKRASGEDTGNKSFLYLVKDDEAYVVDGPADSPAAIAYRNICS
jgi:hypothetical protein